MPPVVKLPLPTGKVGVVFKGTPPVVMKLSDDSPLKGKVKVGYIFESMTLSDGTSFEGLSTPELVSTLNDHSEEEGRKLQLRMGLPDRLELTCPEGDLGITIADVDGKAVLTKIANKSPLKKDIRVGLCVDKLMLEDGMEVAGCSAEEVTEFIADDVNSSGRVLFLANPQMMLSPKGITLPKSKTVDLPVGMLGVSFKNSNELTLISSLKNDSALRGLARAGMAVDTVTMTDGTEFRGLNSEDLSNALKSSFDSAGRKMLLKHPASKDLPTMSTTKLYLPDVGNPGEMGFSLAGDPAAFKEVAETSPVFGKARRGQVVITFGCADGTEYDDLDADELEDILQDTSGSEGRFLLLKNMPMPLPDEQIITLPAGKIGVVFKGSPPSVTRINPDSPLVGAGLVGMVVDTVTLENGEVTYELEAHELTGILNANIESEGRVARFINPTTMELSIPPELEKPDEMEIILPTGKLAIMFKGKAPCSVSSVAKTSPLRAILPIGMAVDSLVIGEQTLIDMDAVTLAGVLSSTSSIEGRILTLKNPDAEDVVFQKMPNTKEVPLPAGKLGVSLKGSPPMATKFADGSPVEGVFPPGMFIDMITMSDGTIMAGLSTAELVAVLADSSEETDRTLTFKNPATKEPSPPGIILPDVKKVRLPSGKIGVFFKGKDMARVSRLQQDSSVRNLLRVGMVVDVIDIPGGKRYAGLTAKEVARILFDTTGVEGRIMILKNPMTSKLSPRDIMANDDDSVITEAEDGADDVSQVG